MIPLPPISTSTDTLFPYTTPFLSAYKLIISKEGWFYENENGHRSPVDKNDFSIQSEGARIVFDVALIAIHGSPGADGLLQGYLDMLSIPYTTCDAATSAITMNKSYTKSVLAGTSGLSFAASVQLFTNDPGGAASRTEEHTSELQSL